MCLQRAEKTENINVKWGSRHTTQVIALSRLSHTSGVLLRKRIAALARGIPPATKAGTLRSHNGDDSEKVTEKNVLSVLSNYFIMIIPVRSFKSLEFMLELKRVDLVWAQRGTLKSIGWILTSPKKWLKICSIVVVQRCFRATHVNRKWSFCTLRPWFLTSSCTNRLSESETHFAI